jgi:hypothetical protein
MAEGCQFTDSAAFSRGRDQPPWDRCLAYTGQHDESQQQEARYERSDKNSVGSSGTAALVDQPAEDVDSPHLGPHDTQPHRQRSGS